MATNTTNSNTGKVINRYSTMSVALGEKISLSSLREEIGLSEKTKLTWKVSESEHVGVNKASNVFVAKGKGEATLTAVQKVDGKEIEHKWKIKVIGKTRRFSDALENFMPMASENAKLKLVELGIYSYQTFLDKVSQENDIEEMAKALEVEASTVRLYRNYAALMQIPEMPYDIAYPAALMGIRNPAEFAKTNSQQFRERIDFLHTIKSERPFRQPEIDTIDKFIDKAKKLVVKDGIQNGFKQLLNTEFRPSLPRTISGIIMYKKNSTDNDVEWKPKAGFKVQLSGIASPTKDKTQDNKDLITYSGADGRFTIVMPERYNMQEALTFTVSENENDPAVLTRRSILGGTGTRSVTFVRLATEVIERNQVEITISDETTDNERETQTFSVSKILANINQLNALNEENARLKDLINKQIKKEFLLNAKTKAKENRKQALNNIIAELRKTKRPVSTDTGSAGTVVFNFNVRPANNIITPVPNNNPTVPHNPDTDEIMQQQCEWEQEEHWRLLNEELCRIIERCEERLECLDKDTINFIIDDNTYEPIPTWKEITTESCGTQWDKLSDLLTREQGFLMSNIMQFPEIWERIGSLAQKAEESKEELVKIVAELESLPEPQQAYPETQQENNTNDTENWSFENYIKQNTKEYDDTKEYKCADNQQKGNAQKWVDNLKKYQGIWDKLGGRNNETPEDLLYRLLNNATLNADMGKFTVTEDTLGTLAGKPSAMPSVRLMGEDSDAVYLPTDTAPSRVFSYGMIQRLIAPEIKTGNREKLTTPLDVAKFREDLYTNPVKQPIAVSLGMGYVLNMHQAWVPDGFALGSLLYSLVLAPGEEQRIIIKEHQESYSVNDQATAMDNIAESYANLQQDNESAAFSNAVDRFSAAHSDYQYYSHASSKSRAGLGFFFGLVGGTSASSTNRGSGSSNASQTDRYDEVSQAAQSFQSSIKTESERIALAKRASIRVASSNESESVASKIIANHNHSHVMTVQYWEVMRRYRMETCISGVDLVLFVPLKPVAFLPSCCKFNLSKNKGATEIMNKKHFADRYAQLLLHADILMNALPYAYRSGLELIKRFASYPEWEYVTPNGKDNIVRLTLNGNFLDCDNLKASLTFFSGRSRIYGRTVSRNVLRIHPSMNTRDKVLYFMRKAREGKYVVRLNNELKEKQQLIYLPWGVVEIEKISSCATADNYYEIPIGRGDMKGEWVFEFHLPASVSGKDIAFVVIENQHGNYHLRLNQDVRYMEQWEINSIEKYEEWLHLFSKDNKNNTSDRKKIEHFAENLPECYTKPEVVISAADIRGMGEIDVEFEMEVGERASYASTKHESKISKLFKGNETESKKDPRQDEPVIKGTFSLMSSSAIDVADDGIPRMFPQDVEKMEKTLHHVVSDTLGYSQRIWASLSDDERILLLEPYTIDMDFSKLKTKDNVSANENDNSGKGENGNDDKDGDNKPTSIPLLNCVNPKKVLGFYGNCMLLPLTFPQKLAERLGKTAGEIQDELYRYHTTSFRVPNTVVSVATEGMVGEAVLGATNVSEKVDLTRFWNWKDSDIDHINIDQSSFRNNSSLLENAQAMAISAPTQSVAPTAHIDSGSLAAALLARSPAQFVDALGNTDLRDLLKSTDNNASAGREAAVQASSGMVNTAVQAAADVAKAYLGSGGGKLSGNTGGGNSSSGGLGGALGNALNETLGNSFGGSVGKILSNAVGKAMGGDKDEENPDNDSEDDQHGSHKPNNPSNPDDSGKPEDSDNAENLNNANGSDKPENPSNPEVSGESDNSSASLKQETSALLTALCDEAIEAMRQGETPISFFAKRTGTSEEQAQAEMERLTQEFFQKHNISIDELRSALKKNQSDKE